MIKNMSDNANPEKTAQILSRYRPIAPKPEVQENSTGENIAMSQKIRDSPYLRNLWPQLQARPTRTRRRGFYSFSSNLVKKESFHGLSSPSFLPSSPAKNLSMHGFSHSPISLNRVTTKPEMGLHFLSCTHTEMPESSMKTQGVKRVRDIELGEIPESCMQKGKNKITEIDLNIEAELPDEKNLSLHLQGLNMGMGSLISPQPIRPVSSRITVRRIKDAKFFNIPGVKIPEEAEKIEEEVELEKLPAVITDSHNKVRMVNYAFNELVGQPECAWIDLLTSSEKRAICSHKCSRLSGEVILHLSHAKVPMSSKGFSGWVTIEWDNKGKNGFVNASADVLKVTCKSKDYLFIWRFLNHFN